METQPTRNETQRRVVKLGSSLGITFPKEFCEAFNLERGDLLKIEVVVLQKAFKAPSTAPATGPAGDTAA